MVVEDEVLVRMIIADRLRDAGYSVIEATNAHEALEALALLGSGVNVVVSDIEMPGAMDGMALARTIRAEHPAIKIVLTSGHSLAIGVDDASACDGFFSKPYDMAQLLRQIQTLLD